MTIWVSRILVVAFVVAVSAASLAASTRAGVMPLNSPQPIRYENYLPILSDFDGDGRLDHAELHLAGMHHCIRIRFGSLRETHLDLGTGAHLGGVLLVRDVNRDNNPDLIWAYSSAEPTLVWLNDGAGHFAKSRNEGVDSAPNSLVPDTDNALTAVFGDERICLVPAQHPSDVVPAANFDHDARETGLPARRDSCHYDSLHLSRLRERGPPEHI